MQNKKTDEFNCIVDTVSFYSSIIISIFMLYVAIIFVIIMVTENEKEYTIQATVISMIFSLLSLIVSLCASRTKFTLNNKTCQIKTKKKIFLSCATESIQRIVILKYGISVQYIVLDCQEYPYLSPLEYNFFNNHLVIRYSLRKLKNIQKYCIGCPIYYDSRINYMP